MDARSARSLLLVLSVLAASTATPHAQGSPADGLPLIRPNDNRVPAGTVSAGTLDLTLTARVGHWFPDGERRPAPLVVPAFAGPDGVPSIPGPLIRVRAGTRIRLTVRNALDGPLAGAPLIVHGLHARPAADDAPLRVEPGTSREVVFQAGEPGTYYYWGSTSDSATVATRGGADSQLTGAIVVDAVSGPVPPDRVFVLSRMVLPAEGSGASRQPDRFVVSINGLSWPLTERIGAAVGDTVRWRWINATNEHHPMHLHGFFYRVDATGDARADTAYAPAERRVVVTERMDEGGTLAMTWVPERAGNWLMHCHLHAHSGPDATWGFPDVAGTGAYGSAFAAAHGAPPGASAGAAHSGHDMARDMAGLVLGIHVHGAGAGPGDPQDTPGGDARRHRVRLTVSGEPVAPGAVPVIEARVQDARAPRARSDVHSVGIAPPIVLRRGEPSAVRVVNRLREPTAVHWHGIELESYFDGVPGWTGGPGGGRGSQLSPEITPRDSFEAHMTPPHAGTFIYHAHALSTLHVGDGLYGALVVLAPDEEYDPSREILWIIGGRERGDGERAFLFLNGRRDPPPLSLQAGRRYRVRLINITESNTADVSLLSDSGAEARPVEWRPLAKDAMPLPSSRTTVRPARVRTSVGETFDFELTAGRPGTLVLEVRNGGDLMVRQSITVR